MAVSLRDESEFWNSAGSCYRASSRDAMPLALRLPRPQGGLAMTQNWSVFVWKTDAFCCMRSFLRGVTSSRDAMPLALRLPRPQGGLAMTQNWSVFVWKTDAFCCMRSFSRGVASCRFSNISFRKLPRFSKNLQILSLRGGRVRPTRQSLTERDGIPERSTAGRISYAARISLGYHRDATAACNPI